MRATHLPPNVWRKSSHSGSQAGECVEVASIWRRSSRSGSQGGDCVEVADAWRKSRQSSSQTQECVEVAPTERAVAVRDSKDPDGPVLTFATHAWGAFLTTLKARDA